MIKGKYKATINIDLNFDDTNVPEEIFETIKDYIESGKMTDTIQNMINIGVIGYENGSAVSVVQNYATVYKTKD